MVHRKRRTKARNGQGSPGNEKTRTVVPGVLPAVRVFFSWQPMEFHCRVREIPVEGLGLIGVWLTCRFPPRIVS